MEETPRLIPGSGRYPGEGLGYPLQYSWVSLVAQLVKNPPAMWETWVPSLGWEDPLEKFLKATHSSIPAWRIPWTAKSQTWLSEFHSLKHSLKDVHWGFLGGTSDKEPACQCRRHGMQVWPLGPEDPLEEGIVTQPRVSAWRIHGQRSLAGYCPQGHTESDITEVTYFQNNS